jgi:FkbM family methyltransferase
MFWFGLTIIVIICLVAGARDECEPSDKSYLSSANILTIANNMIKEHDSGVWLQIGANSMDQELATNNPIMTVLANIPHWDKFFMEPIPHNYDRLVANTKNWPNTTTIQAALSGNGGNFEGVTTMYCLEGYTLEKHQHHTHPVTKLVHSADELCSFDKKHVLKHFPHSAAVEVTVQSMSMTVLLNMYTIRDVRLLVVDTEGFDAAVILALPFHKINPALIIFEHAHLTQQDQKQAEEHLMKQCYHLFRDVDNTYALHKDSLKLNGAR